MIALGTPAHRDGELGEWLEESSAALGDQMQ